MTSSWQRDRTWFGRYAWLCVFSALLSQHAASADNWVHWRGPEQTGVSRETNLPEKFSLNEKDANSNLVWKAPFGGRSTPLILNGYVYVIGDVGNGVNEQERVVCIEEKTGKQVWEQRFNVFHTDIVSSRVGWTNLAGDPETGNVFAHGVQGLLFCFEGKTGKILWQHSLTEEYGRISGYGGRVTSPIVDEQLLIVGMVNSNYGDQARPANRFIAYDKKTGVPVWWSEPASFRGTYYSVPVVAVINGQRLLISGGSDGTVFAMKARTGEPVWSYQIGARSINSSPVVAGNRVYIGHGEENEDTNIKGRFVCLDASQITEGKPKEVWKIDGLRCSYASPILQGNRLYIPDEYSFIWCLNADNGERIWKYKYGRSTAKGSPIWAEGKIYVGEVNAHFYILKPEEKRCKELHDQFFRSSTPGFVEINGNPSVANGRVFLQTRDELICIGKKDWQAQQEVKIPPPPPEAEPETTPAVLQVIPADVVLRPGQSVKFSVRAFDKNGRFIKDITDAAFSLPAPPVPPMAKVGPPPLKGTLESGTLTVVKEMSNQQGPAEATANGLKKRARVRVIPPIPFNQDFEKVPDGRVPGGWINAQGKFEVAVKDGQKALKKLATNPNPALSKANAFIGLPTLTDYTISCDVLGTRKHDEMPDIGIVANRYTLLLDGNKQRLRITSWDALPRVDKTIGFAWKPDVWYRMKFTVDIQGDKGLVRGKVWPRAEAEPREWTIEFEDPTPNREGAPALYGYALGIREPDIGTEIYYDNVSVAPNKKQAARR